VREEKLSANNSPVVSVIIATYNWSAVLHCAVESVLLQTFKKFEILVVGDGCTDDSEQVVLSFGDERIRWINLPTNSGTQAAPNNMGLKLARGRYIAYLGHDDIWLPTHLASLIKTIQDKQADVAGAVIALYGPPTSGAMGVTGVFALGEYSDRDFLPPSSILHKRSLVELIGGWNESLSLCIPTGADFLKRTHNAAGKIVSSGELTVIKFNAAWRRNAYATRSADEQKQLLARVRRAALMYGYPQ
jgi:glycosyltransferase involved in cell wall biosynthesis